MSTKICTGCPENGPQHLDSYYKCNRSKDGHQQPCKICQRAYQADHKDEAAARSRKQRRKRVVRGGPGTLFPHLED